MKNFSIFLNAISDYQIEEFISVNESLNEKLLYENEKCNILQSTNDSIKQHIEAEEFMKTTFIAELNQPLFEEMDEISNCDTQTNSSQLEDEQIKLHAICFEYNPLPGKDVSLTIQHNKNQTVKKFELKNQKWGEIKESCLMDFNIPEDEKDNYNLLELRCRVREDKELIKHSIRSRNLINLVPSKSFKSNTDYQFIVSEIEGFNLVNSQSNLNESDAEQNTKKSKQSGKDRCSLQNKRKKN